MKTTDLKQPLTSRETEILQHIADGGSNTTIGQNLKISPRTVDTHRTNIRRKLQVNSLAGMIRYAIENKIV